MRKNCTFLLHINTTISFLFSLFSFLFSLFSFLFSLFSSFFCVLSFLFSLSYNQLGRPHFTGQHFLSTIAIAIAIAIAINLSKKTTASSAAIRTIKKAATS
jgi:hypothetical protein